MNQNVNSEKFVDKFGGVLAYSFGWLSGIYFINAERPTIRSHGIQSVVVFGSLTIAFIGADAIFPVGTLLHPILMAGILLLSFGLWLLLLFKTYQGELYVVPQFANLTARFMKPFGGIPAQSPTQGPPDQPLL